MTRYQGLWHVVERGVVFLHVGGAVVSGATWLVARLLKLDRSWIVGSAGGFLFCVFMLTLALFLQMRAAWKREHRLPLRRWLELRRYTSVGLTWMIVGRDSTEGQPEATLRVTPTGVELPVPLKLVVSCAGNIQNVVDGKLYPPEIDKYGDLHIYPTDGHNRAFLTLVCPKLYPPIYLEIRLRSAGNADIKILNVRRNPK